MKKLILFCLLFSSLAEACGGLFTTYNIQMTCGEVAKVRNGKILKRLQPSLFGLNDKYVLRTKFLNGTDINETGSCTVFPANPDLSGVPSKINFTNFANKQKFQELKYDLKNELQNAKQTGVSLFACVGHITVTPFRYKGSQVYHSTISTEDAIEQMRAQARRHL